MRSGVWAFALKALSFPRASALLRGRINRIGGISVHIATKSGGGHTRGTPCSGRRVAAAASRALPLRLLLIPPGADDFRNGAVGSAEFQGAFAGSGQDGAAAGLDLGDGGVAIVDLDAPMVDAGAGAGELRLRDLLAVVDHQGEIDVAVGHVARDVAARIAGIGLAKAEDVLIEPGCLLQVGDLDGNVNDARHGLLLDGSSSGYHVCRDSCDSM